MKMMEVLADKTKWISDMEFSIDVVGVTRKKMIFQNTAVSAFCCDECRNKEIY